ncbi:uncharacterized protein LOC130657518 [Hydractinia symbiolongicarpus]|uniref:uncharacterized protein LOC130657518 n=1 Tax=Hydractinia symbiolongicarpus TaxID=13093 RepID=UPI00254E92C5|nr:uncharacterized protein LOC130657518 [Hydractinia symbiolongicarpus]
MGNFDFAVAYELDLERMIDDARVVFHVRRVIYAIDSVISSLHYGLADALLHIFQIGSNHARFGLKRIHFEDMQEALFVLLTDEFGDAFDTSAKLAYAKLFKTIVDHMLAGVESRYEKSIT